MKEKLDSAVKEAIKKWNDDAVSKGLEDFLDNLFEKYPQNTNIDEVLQKINALNLIYATRLGDDTKKRKIAEHIVKLNIDESLDKGDLSVVNKISKTKIRNFYSFASKYCAFHRPNLYALYDSQADSTLWHFQKKDRFSKFKHYELRNYETYMTVIEDFKKGYGLEDFSLRELDHYLWSTGKKK